MTVSVNPNKAVTVSNVTFTLQQFIEDPSRYIPIIADLFRPKTLLRKESETEVERLTRIFHNLYYIKGYGKEMFSAPVYAEKRVQSNSLLSQYEYEILDTFGINMIKHCPKKSKIMFKRSGTSYRIKNETLFTLLGAIRTHKELIHKDLNIRFGVELEFVAEYDPLRISHFSYKMKQLVGEGRYVAEMRYHHNNGDQWELGKDSSVKGRGVSGFELTSPIFTYGNKKDMEELEQVISLVKTVLKGSINKTCGTHVHMSFMCGKATDRLKKHFAKCYKYNEEILFDRLVPLGRRGDSNKYCQSVKPDALLSRYRKLNLCPVVKNSEYMHIEFRQLDGTLDFDKLTTWIKLQKLFVEIALTTSEGGNITLLSLEDVMCDKIFDEKDIESFMSMSKMVA